VTIPPNVAHEGEIARLASAARRAGRGLWSRC
jgi:endonuclease YncB( thermonuclease family)